VLYKALKLYSPKNIQAFLKTFQYDALEPIALNALATDPTLVAQFVSLCAQLNAIPELKTIINYLQDYGGLPFLDWMNTKTAAYGVPNFTRTSYTCEFLLFMYLSTELLL
jgi:hypothetical protein